MNRWCPSCGRPWPSGRVVCPDCLVELVEDPTAMVTCRHCGRVWPARMQSCPNCLAELRPDPEAAAQALGDILAAGGRLLRPEGVPAFRDGPTCTVLRLAPRGNLVITGPEGLVEAAVEGEGVLAVAPLTCRDHDGSVLLALLAYDAAEHALVAYGADGAPLATYLRTAAAAGIPASAGIGSTAGIDVRDETSAPVGALRRGRAGFELVETGGDRVLVILGTTDVELGGWVDDQWDVQPATGRLPLRPLAVVGLALAAKVLLGRPSPVRAEGGLHELRERTAPRRRSP